MARKLAQLLSISVLALAAAAPAQAATTHDVRGEWDLTCSLCGPQSHFFDTQDAEGNITGHNGFTNGPTWTITGKVTGDQIVFVVTYTGGGYQSTSTGTINAGTTLITGTFNDTAGHTNLAFQMHRLSGPPPGGLPGTGGGGTRIATHTQVICTYRYASEDDLCTATVGASTSQVPTGQVTFASPAGGTFPGANSCTLAKSTGSANVASCGVVYLRPYEVPPARSFPNVTASYSGDGTFAASSGSTQLLGCAINPTTSAAPAAFTGTGAHAGTGARAAAVGENPFFTLTDKQTVNSSKGNCYSSVPSMAVIAGAIPTKPTVATASTVISATQSEWLDWARFQVDTVDPVDRHYRSIVKPRKVRVPHFAPSGKKGTGLQRALDAYLANESSSLSLQRAQLTSIYRAQTAVNEKQPSFASKQMLAAAKFTAKIAKLRRRHRSLANRLASALKRSKQDVKLTPALVRKGQARIRSRGLPRGATRALRRIVGAKGVKQLRASILRVDPSTAKGSLAALIRAAAADDAKVAKVLSRVAARMKANPSNVPGV